MSDTEFIVGQAVWVAASALDYPVTKHEAFVKSISGGVAVVTLEYPIWRARGHYWENEMIADAAILSPRNTTETEK